MSNLTDENNSALL